MEEIIMGTVPEKGLVVEMDIPEMGGTIHAVILSVTEVTICDGCSEFICIMYAKNTLFEAHCHCHQFHSYDIDYDASENILYLHHSDLVFWGVIAENCTIPSIPNTL